MGDDRKERRFLKGFSGVDQLLVFRSQLTAYSPLAALVEGAV
jgi:hypothetical protein